MVEEIDKEQKKNLTKRIIELFQPREKGITMTCAMVTQRLELDEKDIVYVEKLMQKLEKDRVLYSAFDQHQLYALNPLHLWNT